jgi:8-oxo-dGTP pyrophosphatase MutT (NUDIX family)
MALYTVSFFLKYGGLAMTEKRYTARVLVTPQDSNGRIHLVTIEDADKNNRSGGTYLAVAGGGNHGDEFPFQTAERELLEETGLSAHKALTQMRELGVIHLSTQNRPPHEVYYFEIRFPFEYVEETLRAIEEGRLEKKEKNIRARLMPAPIDPREFLGTQYSQIREVAQPLHRRLFF